MIFYRDIKKWHVIRVVMAHYLTVDPPTCPLTWFVSFQYATPLVTDALVGVCACARVRCQHFIRNRSADGLSPHLKDVARRGEAHLCHGWHFNLSLLAVLFPSIVHQCIRTNAMGHKGISGFDSIDTHLWLRLQCSSCCCCCSCRGSRARTYRCVRRGETNGKEWVDNRSRQRR